MTVAGEGIVLVIGNFRDTRIDVRSRNGDVLRSVRLTGAGLLRFPSGVAVDGAGNFVVADSGNDRIVVFDATGVCVRAFSGSGSGAGVLEGPSGVAVDGAGSVYVADQRNHRVVVFDGAGRVLRTLGGGDGELTHPKGVAVDGAGSVYVADWGNDRVVVFDGAGRVLRTLGGGELSHPRGVAVDGAGSVYVVDNLKDRILVFSGAGDFAGALWPGDERFFGTSAWRWPKSVAVDGAGNVFVLNHHYADATDSVVVFEQPMRSYEEHMQKRALALCMSLHRRLGADAQDAHQLDDEVLRFIWDAVAWSPDDLGEVAPGRRIM
jgi:hypothetical protein